MDINKKIFFIISGLCFDNNIGMNSQDNNPIDFKFENKETAYLMEKENKIIKTRNKNLKKRQIQQQQKKKIKRMFIVTIFGSSVIVVTIVGIIYRNEIGSFLNEAFGKDKKQNDEPKDEFQEITKPPLKQENKKNENNNSANDQGNQDEDEEKDKDNEKKKTQNIKTKRIGKNETYRESEEEQDSKFDESEEEYEEDSESDYETEHDDTQQQETNNRHQFKNETKRPDQKKQETANNSLWQTWQNIKSLANSGISYGQEKINGILESTFIEKATSMFQSISNNRIIQYILNHKTHITLPCIILGMLYYYYNFNQENPIITSDINPMVDSSQNGTNICYDDFSSLVKLYSDKIKVDSQENLIITSDINPIVESSQNGTNICYDDFSSLVKLYSDKIKVNSQKNPIIMGFDSYQNGTNFHSTGFLDTILNYVPGFGSLFAASMIFGWGYWRSDKYVHFPR